MGRRGGGKGSALHKAQEIMYEAWEAPTRQRAIALARKALEVSPDCADAYNLLAEEAAESLEEALELCRKGVEAGERVLVAKEKIPNLALMGLGGRADLSIHPYH